MNDLLDLSSVLADPALIAVRVHETYAPLSTDSSEPAVVFPPTYAPPKDSTKSGGDARKSPGIYQKDLLSNGRATVLIDSVGSQANRMEALFLQPENQSLAPSITVVATGKDASVSINLLEMPHRVADALIRFAGKPLVDEVQEAIHAYRDGNAAPLARLAPTSLLFGFWDSRASHVKAPRLVESQMRAWDVTPIHRAAQFTPAARMDSMGIVSGPPTALEAEGFIDAPSVGTPGGVVLNDGVVHRDALINLVALRALRAHAPGAATTDAATTQALHHYLLALALLAVQAPMAHLRQGALLRRLDHTTTLIGSPDRAVVLPAPEDLRRAAASQRPAFGSLYPATTFAFDDPKANAAITARKPKGQKGAQGNEGAS